MPLVRRIWGSPHTDEVENNPELSNSKPLSEAFWTPTPLALKDIAIGLASAMVIVLISFKLSAFLKEILGTSYNIAMNLFISLVTDKYLLLTTITFITVSIFKKSFE